MPPPRPSTFPARSPSDPEATGRSRERSERLSPLGRRSAKRGEGQCAALAPERSRGVVEPGALRAGETTSRERSERLSPLGRRSAKRGEGQCAALAPKRSEGVVEPGALRAGETTSGERSERLSLLGRGNGPNRICI
jgi:hypothetical protein